RKHTARRVGAAPRSECGWDRRAHGTGERCLRRLRGREPRHSWPHDTSINIDLSISEVVVVGNRNGGLIDDGQALDRPGHRYPTSADSVLDAVPYCAATTRQPEQVVEARSLRRSAAWRYGFTLLTV